MKISEDGFVRRAKYRLLWHWYGPIIHLSNNENKVLSKSIQLELEQAYRLRDAYKWQAPLYYGTSSWSVL